VYRGFGRSGSEHSEGAKHSFTIFFTVSLAAMPSCGCKHSREDTMLFRREETLFELFGSRDLSSVTAEP